MPSSAGDASGQPCRPWCGAEHHKRLPASPPHGLAPPPTHLHLLVLPPPSPHLQQVRDDGIRGQALREAALGRRTLGAAAHKLGEEMVAAAKRVNCGGEGHSKSQCRGGLSLTCPADLPSLLPEGSPPPPLLLISPPSLSPEGSPAPPPCLPKGGAGWRAVLDSVDGEGVGDKLDEGSPERGGEGGGGRVRFRWV